MRFVMYSTATVVESQVDWLTCSAIDERGRDGLLDLGVELLAEQGKANKVKDFHLHGYTGSQAGHVKVGIGGDRVLLMLGGDPANEWFDFAVAHADNVSRIDLAVTVKLDQADKDVAKRGQQEYASNVQRGNRYPNACDLYDGTSGSTLYVGKRESAYFARLYDKGRQSKLDRYSNCWRYECEYKEDYARNVAAACGRATDRSAFCAGTVYSDWVKRGIRPIYEPTRMELYGKGFDRATDVDTKLRWLAATVRPVVRFLTEHGHGDLAIDALNPRVPIPVQCPACGSWRCLGNCNGPLTQPA